MKSRTQFWTTLLMGGAISIGLLGCGSKDNSLPPTPLSKVAPSLIQVQTLWSKSVGAGIEGQYVLLSPALSDQSIVTVDYKGQVTLLQKASGQVQWKKDVGFTVGASPVFAGNRVIIGGLSGQVVALDVSSGKTLWNTSLQSSIVAAPAAGEGKIALQLHDASVVVLNAENGKVVWVQDGDAPPLTLSVNSSPVIDHDQVIVGSPLGVLTAYSLKNGQVIWSRPIALAGGDTEIARMVDIAGTPALVDGILYAAAYHGNVVALSADKGNLVFEHSLSVYNAVSVGQGRLFVTDESGWVWALDTQTGRTLWVQKQLAARSLSAPVVVNQNEIALGDYAGYVHWLSIQDGRLLARTQIDSTGISASPVAANGLVYVLSNNGKLAVLSPVNP